MELSNDEKLNLTTLVKLHIKSLYEDLNFFKQFPEDEFMRNFLKDEISSFECILTKIDF